MGHSASTPTLTPFTSPSRLPLSHKAAGLSDDDAHKLLLLECLFKSLDTDNHGYVDRQIVQDWLATEPYFKIPRIRDEAERMLERLDQDEDSQRVSYREFVLSFLAFNAYEVQLLCINLLRTANTSHDIHAFVDLTTSNECDRAAGYSDIVDEQNLRSLFLLDTIFSAMDDDEDDTVDDRVYFHWLSEDHWFENDSQQPLTLAIKTTATNTFTDTRTSIERLQFLSAFIPLPRRYIKLLLIHLLHRSTHRVVRQAKLERKKSAVLHHRDLSSQLNSPLTSPRSAKLSKEQIANFAISHESTIEGQWLLEEAVETEALTQDESMSIPLPSPPQSFTNMLSRRHSIMVGGGQRTAGSTSDLRLCLLGQSMLQHSLCDSDRGRSTLESIKHTISASNSDIVFGELESAIVPRYTSDFKPLRAIDSVFFHAADPGVLDSLSSMGINLYGASNNHAGDFGETGVLAMIDEMRARNLTFAGIGRNESEAAAPVYKHTNNGKVALISFACKVPVGSDATSDRGGVNAVWMENLDSQKLRKRDVKKVLESIIAAKESDSDLIVVYNHNHYRQKSNINEVSEMGSWVTKLARKIIDAGAHVYVGHGEPRIQGIEIYKHGIIFYGLGSLIFQTRTEVGFYDSTVWEGVIVQLHCRGINGSNGRRAEPSSPTAVLTPPHSPLVTDDDDGEQSMIASEVASYSIKLIPIVLNERGDGFDADQHENAVKGSGVIADKIAQHTSSNSLTNSITNSPLSLVKSLATNNSGYEQVPSFLSPPPFSLTQSPVLIGHRASVSGRLTSPPLSPSRPTKSLKPPLASLAASTTAAAIDTNANTSLVIDTSSDSHSSPRTLLSSYDLHLSTRGLPSLAPRQQALTILRRLQSMSAEFGTIIHIDDPFQKEANVDGSVSDSVGDNGNDSQIGVIGWVTFSGSAVTGSTTADSSATPSTVKSVPVDGAAPLTPLCLLPT